jgi:hypothetical protein
MIKLFFMATTKTEEAGIFLPAEQFSIALELLTFPKAQLKVFLARKLLLVFSL